MDDKEKVRKLFDVGREGAEVGFLALGKHKELENKGDRALATGAFAAHALVLGYIDMASENREHGDMWIDSTLADIAFELKRLTGVQIKLTLVRPSRTEQGR